MNAVKIKQIGKVFEVDTKYGKKQKRSFTVEDNMGNTFEVTKFISPNDPEVKVGEEILMELQKSEDGKYINCKKIEKFTPIEPPAPEPEEEKVDWDGKEKRDFKGRCLMYAIETLKLSNVEKLEESDIASLIKMRAIDYFDWIYTGETTPF